MTLRRRTLLGLATGAAFGLGSCVRVPTGGPVEAVTPSEQAPRGPQVVSQPKPPVPGDSPLGIVYGFLAAMQDYEPGYATARQYLTPDAAQAWNPAAQTTIYESQDHPVVSTEKSATLRAPMIGTLDASGYFRATNVVLDHDFELAQVSSAAGPQWRIGQPPAGLLISRLTFESYSQIAVQFLTPDTKNLMAGIRLVPDLCYLPEGRATPTVAAQVLFAGPSEWLAPAVMTAIPAGGKLSVPSVAIDQGVAEVTLSDPVTALTGERRTWLGAQVVWTLSEFSQVRGVRFTANQQPWAVEGQGGDGVLRTFELSEFPSAPAAGPDTLVAVREGAVGQVDLPSGRFTPFPGALGRLAKDDAAPLLAADAAMARVAMVIGGKTLKLATPEGEEISTAFQGSLLTRPQFLDDGTIWLAGRDQKGVSGIYIVGIDNQVQRLALPDEMNSLPVQTLRISPDRTRVAVIAGEKREYLGMLRLRVGATPVVDQWRSLPLSGRQSIPLTRFSDLGWVDGATMVVLGAPAQAQVPGAYLVSVDGARLAAFGSVPSQAEPSSLAVAPTRSEPLAMALGAQGLYRLVGGATTWTQVASNLSAVAFPG